VSYNKGKQYNPRASELIDILSHTIN